MADVTVAQAVDRLVQAVALLFDYTVSPDTFVEDVQHLAHMVDYLNYQTVESETTEQGRVVATD